MGSDLGVFEAMENAGKISAEAAAKQGHDLARDIDRAIFRAKERFGAYLANSQSKSEFDERWAEAKSKGLISVVAEVTKPTPGVLRKVEAALRPSLPAQAPTKQARPSSAKTAATEGKPWIADPVERAAMAKDLKIALASDRLAALKKEAWSYDQTTNLYTSKDPMQKFACPGCGTEQEHLGFNKCAGCERQWNSWPVRQTGTDKTSASTYVLMAREIKMRGDQFKMASMGNVPSPQLKLGEKIVVEGQFKIADGPQEPPPGVSQPTPGTMPGDNSGAVGEPMPPEQPPTPGAGMDNDIAGGVTENSPIDQIQDALQDAIVSLKDVQMLSINPQLAAMGGLKLSAQVAENRKLEKIAKLRADMDRFWKLHKQMNYVAGMLATEAREALKEADPRITSEAQFAQGYQAAARNEPLPPKTARAWLEGFVAFHKQADTYSDGADYDRIFEPDGGEDKSTGADNSGSFLGDSGPVPSNEIRGDAGPFDASQPASQDFARDTDRRNAQGEQDRGQGSSSTIQPTSARRTPPRGKK